MTRAGASARRTDGGRVRLREVEFSEIDTPGTYVMHATGLLVRVPPDGVAAGRSPVIVVAGNTPVRLSLLSDDPWLPLNRARSIAANHDLPVSF